MGLRMLEVFTRDRNDQVHVTLTPETEACYTNRTTITLEQYRTWQKEEKRR